MRDVCTISVNGSIYSGWSDVTIHKTIEAAASAFSISVTETLDARKRPIRINAQDECVVMANGIPLVTGYVDRTESAISSGSLTRTISGRDKTADLVDCAAVHNPDEWSGLDLLSFAGIICKPFGIKVSADVDIGGPFSVIKLEPGESALEALARYARRRSKLLIPDGKGGLLITNTSTKTAEARLEQGVNIVSASGSIDYSQRFKTYEVKTQGAYSAYSEDADAEAFIVGKSEDSEVKRYRPLVLVGGDDASESGAADLAKWEALNRAGRSSSLSVEVAGWRQNLTGNLWDINTLVRVTSDAIGVDGVMLIAAVEFTMSSQRGTVTKLDLVGPQAYTPKPIKIKPGAAESYAETDD